MTLSKETFKDSHNLVVGVLSMVEDYIILEEQYYDEYAMVDAVDDAIKELEMWKKEIMKGSHNVQANKENK